jgi:hypothetical protein
LFTNTSSPSRIDGFIEPVGTQFQSSTEDLTGEIAASLSTAEPSQ